MLANPSAWGLAWNKCSAGTCYSSRGFCSVQRLWSSPTGAEVLALPLIAVEAEVSRSLAWTLLSPPEVVLS